MTNAPDPDAPAAPSTFVQVDNQTGEVRFYTPGGVLLVALDTRAQLELCDLLTQCAHARLMGNAAALSPLILVKYPQPVMPSPILNPVK